MPLSSHLLLFNCVFIAPSQKSDVWRFFDKTEENKNSAKCRLCQKFIKSCGNTTNLIGHLKNIHKAAYQEFSNECSKKNDIQSNTVKKNTHLSLDPNISDPLPSTSSAGIMTMELTSNAEKKCDSSKDDVCVSIPPAPKRQKSIVTSFQDIYAFSERGDKTLRINNALIYMICKDNQPFTIVENEGFASLIKVLAPHYKLPSKTTLTRWVDDKYAALSTVFKAKLANIVHVTLTTDMWSETMSMRSFLGITAHFGEGNDIFAITLGVYESNDRHTSEHISDMLLNTCTEWNIDNDKVSAVVTDNAANMVKAVDLAFGKKHIPCFAHTLNLVAQNAIQQCADLRNLITKLKEIVTWFKQSNVASNELRKATEKETKLIQEVPTRWNSSYYMIERFLELRTVVNNIIIRHKNAPPMLTASELSVLSSVLQILRPIEAATKEVSGDKYCTSSKVIPLIHCLLLKVKPLKVEESLAQELQALVLKEIDKRMGAIERVTPFAVATILDPRFKKMHFTDPLTCSTAVSKIKEMMKSRVQNEIVESDSSDNSEKPEKKFSLWDDHHKLVHKSWKTTNLVIVIWNDLKIQLPKLHSIAYKYLTMVGTSVPSERLFSKAAQVVNQQRNRLKGKRLNKLLFLQSLPKEHWK
ncbi:zinc finger BED domain-containing protein 1-like [Spodoptera litura]|uniref:Zinc finger BED domain-containing protein 1-like n=1 Tax=Spodoptera litura TaxID=69820 RepID=A0A9J7E6T9_SPOLT|nr:zinc finger BED domain-containing protein 1-like [Spodoptera litura]